MVDFDNETTIGTPASDVVKILILQRRADLFEAIEDYNKRNFKGIEADISIFKARLITLWIELEETLKRTLNKIEYETLKRDIYSDTEGVLMDCTLKLNAFIGNKLRLTRLDTKQQYDSTRADLENRKKGI
jgi:hypothetical protein